MARGIANKSPSLPWLLLLWLSVKLLAQIGLPFPLETDTTVPFQLLSETCQLVDCHTVCALTLDYWGIPLVFIGLLDLDTAHVSPL